MTPPNPNLNESIAYTQNRDLSYLRFNYRVLGMAGNPSLPLFERIKFLQIYQRNLDEFCMIRIGSLMELVQLKKSIIDWRTGLPMSEVIRSLMERIQRYNSDAETIYTHIINDLHVLDLNIVPIKHIDKSDLQGLKEYFSFHVEPYLAPNIIVPGQPFPHLISKAPYVILRLERKESDFIGVIPIPTELPALIWRDNLKGYVRLDDIIHMFSEGMFPTYQCTERAIISVTRNADLDVVDDFADDTLSLKNKMKKLLNLRKNLRPVRLEISRKLPDKFMNRLLDDLGMKKYQVIVSSLPYRLDFLSSLVTPVTKKRFARHFYPVHVPSWPATIDSNASMMSLVRMKDRLLHFPFHSIHPFLKLLQEAAMDPQVNTISMTIYRLASESKIIDTLVQAAQNGKRVLIVLELRARFDEQNNIDWSERLEQAGCHVIYGFEGKKVHSKICVIERQLDDHQMEYFTQVGTGNYNERTVELYNDLSLMTCDPSIGKSAVKFFHDLEHGYMPELTGSLVNSPFQLKQMVLDEIDREIAKGEDGYIAIKNNAITDQQCMEKLVQASQARVPVDLSIRSICCIRPQVPGYTETTRIISIVWRFLEHARIYRFGKGEDTRMWISSADLMTRNTERRIEIAVQIHDVDIKKYLCQLLDDNFKDTENGAFLNQHGHHLVDAPYLTHRHE